MKLLLLRISHSARSDLDQCPVDDPQRRRQVRQVVVDLTSRTPRVPMTDRGHQKEFLGRGEVDDRTIDERWLRGISRAAVFGSSGKASFV
jgi:hypothetical protein